jgi:23S rRNA pseudouridine2605 synthase
MTEHSRSPRQPRKKGAAPGGSRGSGAGKGGYPPGAGGRSTSRSAGKAGGKTGARFAGSTKPSQPTRLPDRNAPAPVDVHDPDGVRLQKLMAAAGVGSRRVCENLITQGRVEVDGQIVTELGVLIDAKSQVVQVDGVRINLDEDRVYLAFNKPKGVVTTMHDELGRISLEDYVGNREERLFHVGRLDADTEGLLLLTNLGINSLDELPHISPLLDDGQEGFDFD